MDIIVTTNLTKQYNHKLAVNNVNMHVPQGSIYGFVGENGSGKTTIMRMLTGLAIPTNGTFSLFGVENKDKQINAQREKMSAIVETTSLVPTMTAMDNLKYQCLYSGLKLSEQEMMNILQKVHLGNVAYGKKVKNFSLGMKQRLGIAMALISKPQLMLLDEPMNGLDPEGIAELRDLLIELNQKEGLTVLISSHILSELEKIASHYGFISHGCLLEEVTATELHEKCRKIIELKVDNIEKATEVLNNLYLTDYKASPNGDIKIFDNVDIGDLVVNMKNAQIKILAINTIEGSVEDYFLNISRSQGGF